MELVDYNENLLNNQEKKTAKAKTTRRGRKASVKAEQVEAPAQPQEENKE